MRWLLVVAVLLGTTTVQARPAKSAVPVWYVHPVMGGGESGDWLMLHRVKNRIEGAWFFYQVGPKRDIDIQCQPFTARVQGSGWDVSTVAWDGERPTILKFDVVGGPRLGQPTLKLLCAEMSSSLTNLTFRRTAPPRFLRRSPCTVHAALVVMGLRLEEMRKPR